MYAVYAGLGAIVGFVLALYLMHTGTLYVQRRKTTTIKPVRKTAQINTV